MISKYSQQSSRESPARSGRSSLRRRRNRNSSGSDEVGSRRRGKYDDSRRSSSSSVPRRRRRSSSTRRKRHSDRDKGGVRHSDRGGKSDDRERDRGRDRDRNRERDRDRDRYRDKGYTTGSKRDSGKRYIRRFNEDTDRTKDSRRKRYDSQDVVRTKRNNNMKETRVDHTVVPPFFLRVMLAFDKLTPTSNYVGSAFKTFAEQAELQVYAWMDTTIRQVLQLAQDVSEAARDPYLNFHFRLVKFKDGEPEIINLASIHNTFHSRNDFKTLRSVDYAVGDIIDVCVTRGRHSQPMEDRAAVQEEMSDERDAANEENTREERSNERERNVVDRDSDEDTI